MRLSSVDPGAPLPRAAPLPSSAPAERPRPQEQRRSLDDGLGVRAPTTKRTQRPRRVVDVEEDLSEAFSKMTIGRPRSSLARRATPEAPVNPVDAQTRPERVGRFGLRLTHVGVPVLSLAESRKFWGGVLGLSTAARQPAAPGIHWVEIEDQQFHLFENKARGSEAVTTTFGESYDPTERTLIFAARGLDRVRSKLERQGFAPIDGQVNSEGPAVLCQDPNGYWLAFVEEKTQHDVNATGLPLTRFLGVQVPAVSVRTAIAEMVERFDLPRLEGDMAGAAGVEAGAGRKILFSCSPKRANEQSTLSAGIAREFHVNLDGDREGVRSHILSLGHKQPIDETLAFAGADGGGACQTFSWVTGARFLVEVSEIVDSPEACSAQRPRLPTA